MWRNRFFFNVAILHCSAVLPLSAFNNTEFKLILFVLHERHKPLLADSVKATSLELQSAQMMC